MLIVAREVAWRRVRHQWRFRCEHLPTESKTIADSFSRFSAVPAKPFPKEAAHAIQRSSPTWPQLFRARTLLSQDPCVSENSATYQSQVSCNVGHSVRCLSSLLAFGVSLRCVFCVWGLLPLASLCVFSADSVGCVLTQRFRALQCNTTLGLLRLVSLGIFSAHSVGFVLTRDSVRCSVKRLWVWSHPCLFALSVQVLHWGFLPPVSLSVSRTRFAMGLLSPLSLSQRPPDRL